MKFNNITPTLVQKNLQNIYEQVTPSWHDEGNNWYNTANVWAERFSHDYNVDKTIVAAIISVLSPQKSWFQNIIITQQFLQSKGKKAKHYSMQVNKAKQLYTLLEDYHFATEQDKISIIEQIIGGRKTINFFHNINEPYSSEHCTIDSHMIQLMTGNRSVKGVTNKQYDFLVQQLRHFAAMKDECVPVLQAKLWLTFRVIKKY